MTPHYAVTISFISNVLSLNKAINVLSTRGPNSAAKNMFLPQPLLPPLTLVKVSMCLIQPSPSYTANEPPRGPSERELIERLEGREVSRILVHSKSRGKCFLPASPPRPKKGGAQKALGTQYTWDRLANCG